MDMRRILSRAANKVVIRNGRGGRGSCSPWWVIDYIECIGYILDGIAVAMMSMLRIKKTFAGLGGGADSQNRLCLES